MQIFRKNHRYTRLKNRANRLAQTFRLDLEYKNVDTPVTDNFIFHLPDFTLTNANKPWQSQLDLQKPYGPRVVLRQASYAHHPQNLHFYHMLSQMTTFMNDFTSLVGKWAVIYQQQENKQQSLVNDLTLFDAMTTIYTNFFHLSLSETHNLLDLWDSQFHSQQVPQDKFAKCIISQHHLQQSGAQFFNLIDRPDHHIATNIDAIFINKTAEKFLLKLAKHNLVLGMSATVNLKTVISNFDFNYLRGQLGSRLLDGRDYLSRVELDQLDVAKRCRQHHVQVQVTEADGQLEGPDGTPGLTLILQKHLSSEAYASLDQTALMQLNQQFSQEIKAIQATNDFEERRYLKLFESFIIFLKDPTLTSFLGLQTLLPKSAHNIGANAMRTEFIQEIFNSLESLLSFNEQNRPQLRIIAKHADKQQTVEQQLKAALQLPESQATRVFLLSAYGTLGVGMNLQHQLGAFERKLVINIAPDRASKADKRQKQVDLSGIYLGDVTQIFEHVSTINQLTTQNIHYLLQLCYLVDNGEVSPLAVRRHLQNLNRGRHDKQFRDTLSYIWAYTHTVLQALGRMDRTYNKTSTLQAVVDANVLNYFNVHGLRPYQQGPVAQALQQFCETNREAQLSPEQFKYHQWNELIQQTQNTVVRNWVPRLQKDPRVAAYYQELREYLLAHPTLYEWEYRKIQLKAGYDYLPLAKSAYRVQRRGDDFQFTPDGNEFVSAATAQLATILSYPGMRDYFEAHHWALTWEARDYILNPIHFDSYLGVLGEKVGQFILHDIWAIQTQKLSDCLNELFDAQIIGTHTLIDYKNWHHIHQRSLEQERQNVRQKLEIVRHQTGYSDWKVLFVNLMQPDSSSEFVQRVSENGTLLEIPALLDSNGQLALSTKKQKQIGAFIQ